MHYDIFYDVVDFERIAATTAVTAFNTTKISPSDKPMRDAAYITTDAPIRFRLDGNSPTTAIGHALAAGDSMLIRYGNLAHFKVIASTTATTNVDISYMQTG
jgi:hypothetical protein